MIDLQGARTVITGAGGDIGGALVAAFAAAGARIVACDVAGADLTRAGIVERHHFDLRDASACAGAAAAILAGGPPRIVVSNAGWTRADTLDQTTADGIEDEMAANYTGAAQLTLVLSRAMRALPGDKAMTFVSSINALGHHGNPPYSAAKAALLAWMRALAVEEGRHGLRANAVTPASVRTRGWGYRLQADPTVLDRVSSLYPLGRIVTTQEVANTVLFLSSPLASGITGSTICVDAGLMAGNLSFLGAISDAIGTSVAG